jgi:hypothetical protein
MEGNALTYNEAEQRKLALLSEIRQKVEIIGDRLGKGIDDGVKETCVFLMAHEFSLSASCEGHNDWGLPYPWVEVSIDPPKDWNKNQEKNTEWIESSMAQRSKLLDLLQEFYAERQVNLKTMLHFDNIGIFGALRLQPMAGELSESMKKEEKAERLKEFQNEMSEFTAFLKKKFLTSY